ncbi:hypothetical protein [Burkholderia multivorans]|uniref:hypothetical protein n=1 Tax=Burkholderia multivorans TaxID=87883 RepID=UPI001FC8E3F8|nr:hypothetical protein [Burkholderia multivorans]
MNDQQHSSADALTDERRNGTGAEVAQWQMRLKDRSSPVVDHWVNISPDGAKTLMEKYADVYEVRALYTAPRSPAVAAEPAASPAAVIPAGWNCVPNIPPAEVIEFYGDQYSEPVLLHDGKTIMPVVARWDFTSDGWVDAQFRDGPSPADYEWLNDRAKCWLLLSAAPQPAPVDERAAKISDYLNAPGMWAQVYCCAVFVLGCPSDVARSAADVAVKEFGDAACKTVADLTHTVDEVLRVN